MELTCESVKSEVQRHRTALTRYSLSAPMQALGKYGYLDGQHTLFDYGCGKGGDLEILDRNGVNASGWDPHYRPTAQLREADVVNLGFVLNVIDDVDERAEALLRAFELANKLLSVAVMLSTVVDSQGEDFNDGLITSRGTFQKYFTQDELRHYIATVLGEESIAVGPGLYFVFKDKEAEQQFLEQRQRNRHALDRLIQRIPKPTREEREKAFYEENGELLDAIWDIWLTQGRPPRDDEVPRIEEIRESFGTLARALGFLRRFNGDEAIKAAFSSRQQDLRIFLGLLEFEQKYSYRNFSESLRRDLRTFFGSIQNARQSARKLLFSTGNSELIEIACKSANEDGFGWLDEDLALIIHTSVVPELSPLLRMYIGCASKLYGDVSNADLLKIHARTGKLTLTNYADFETSPLPRMVQRVKLNLRAQRIDVFEYDIGGNAPYLYWKSRFIPTDFPKYSAQKAFDDRLSRTLLNDFCGYGPTVSTFNERLQSARLTVNGFSLKSVGGIPSLDECCGQYLTFKDFFLSNGNSELAAPRNEWIYEGLNKLVVEVLDPLMDYFGGIQLWAWQWAGKDRAMELKESTIEGQSQLRSPASRLGECVNVKNSVGVEFFVPDEDMLEVAQWISGNTDFHRLAYRGNAVPLSVSVAPRNSRKALIERSESSKAPRWVSSEQLSRLLD